MEWIVAQTKPFLEEEVALSLTGYGYVCYCPLARVKRERNRRKWEALEPLFSRYLFAADNSQCAAIRRIRGITSVIMQGERMARVSDAVIESIRAREVNGAVPLDTAPTEIFRDGAKVRISDGPYKGFEAVYRAKSGSDRALILVKMLGTTRPATIRISDLERVA